MGKPGERMAWYLNSPQRDRPRKPQSTAERARLERWRYPAAARVTHPDHDTVVVPCRSKLSAIMCAAEVWGCNWAKLEGVGVWRAEPRDRVAAMPHII